MNHQGQVSPNEKFTHGQENNHNKMCPHTVWDSCWSAAINKTSQEVVVATSKLMPGWELPQEEDIGKEGSRGEARVEERSK